MLHLPLRYEDHTRARAARIAVAGPSLQAEGRVVNTDIQYRPRRQLVALIADGDGGATRAARPALLSRSIPTSRRRSQPGIRVRVFGDVREGHFGARDRASAIQGRRRRMRRCPIA